MKNLNQSDINELKKSVENGTVDDFIDKKLSPQASQKLKEVLADKSATQRLLDTPEAKSLLQKLMNKQD
ncbi:MAG: hypothetical protein PUE46_01115 [Eubacteriales bacterium]|nr:hypothetical protein [Eubacteriales bacterium]